MFGGDDPDLVSPRDSAAALTPSKRSRNHDQSPVSCRSSSGRGPNNQDITTPMVPRNEGETAAQLGQLLAGQILPHLMDQMNDRFNALQCQYQDTVSQASKLFGEVQHAMVSLQTQQVQLSSAIVSEQKTLAEHHHAIRSVKKEQDNAVNTIGVQKANLDHVREKQASVESDMRPFASNVMGGFNKTEETFRLQEHDRFALRK